MTNEQNDRIVILGEGSLEQLMKAMNVLLQMTPNDENGNGVISVANVEEWRKQLREQMSVENIDTDALQRLSTPSKVVSIGVKNDRIVLNVDKPDTADDKAHIEDYIAFFKWILSDDKIGRAHV